MNQSPAGAGEQLDAHSPTPKESAARCSVRAEFREDPMLGTAFPAGRLLLVEQPGPWGRAGLTQSQFAPEVAARLMARADTAGMRVIAVRRPGRSLGGATRAWALADCRQGREALRWNSFTRDQELLTADWDTPGDPGVQPAYLVCAHGSHDACCALRGRPVAAALARLRPEQVWECSHVGGDRFAANVLTLPTGLLYGSVHPGEAAALVAATESGLALPEPLRGKVGVLPEAQVALARAYAEWGGPVRAIRADRVLRDDAGRIRAVRVVRPAEGRSALVTVSSRRAPVHRLTCQMTEPATVLTYAAVSFEELPG